jgi:hypothetical protein
VPLRSRHQRTKATIATTSVSNGQGASVLSSSVWKSDVVLSA